MGLPRFCWPKTTGNCGRLVTQVLGRNGYRMVEAATGEQALQLAHEFDGEFDLLISDVIMANVSGPELARTLQSANPALRVLMISGTADATVLDELLPGNNAFLAKPFARANSSIRYTRYSLAIDWPGTQGAISGLRWRMPGVEDHETRRTRCVDSEVPLMLLNRRFETVANAAYGLDPKRMVGINFDLGAQTTDVLGHRGFILPFGRGGPDVLE